MKNLKNPRPSNKPNSSEVFSLLQSLLKVPIFASGTQGKPKKKIEKANRKEKDQIWPGGSILQTCFKVMAS